MLVCTGCGAGAVRDSRVRPIRCQLCGGRLQERADATPRRVTKLVVTGWCPYCEDMLPRHQHTLVDGSLVVSS